MSGCSCGVGHGASTGHAVSASITVEESSSHGRLDMAVRAAGHVYLCEFKVAEMAPPGSALAQLRERRYADKYRAAGDANHLIGVEFSRATRNIIAFETATPEPTTRGLRIRYVRCRWKPARFVPTGAAYP